MKSRFVPLAVLVLLVFVPTTWSFYKAEKGTAGKDMTVAASRFAKSLSDAQREQALLPYDTPKRVDWHFIPKDFRKGLQLKEMNDQQRKLAHTLLRSALSELGYDKATKIMQLETLLHHLEMGKGRNIRDPQRYYFTLFGEPKADGRWGVSIEGHHLSFNFVVEGNKVIASTPQFMAANPAEVKGDYLAAVKKGTRVLAKEETLAFELVNSLSAEQAKTAILDKTAPREIRAAGEPQPPTDAPAGLPAGEMTAAQQKILRALMDEYLSAMPYEVAAERSAAIEKAGFAKIHFAWAGAKEAGVGHYYRVQGPTFLIEFVNTQPDAAGNPANHIHCVWRNMQGDFALPIGG